MTDSPGTGQKRCAKCGAYYAADYDACPSCTKSQQTQEALKGCGEGLQGLGCLLILFVTVPILLFMLFGLRGCA